MKIALPFLLLTLGGFSLLPAQESALVLDPPLSQVFPLDVRPDGVRVPYPVLINEHMVLGPAAVLRFIYIDPNAGTRTHGGAGGDNGFRTHVGPGGRLDSNDSHDGGAAGGWGKNDGDDSVGLFDGIGKKDDAKRNQTELQSEVWKQKDLFVEAFNHAAEAGTTIVYMLPPKPKLLTSDIDLPEGMLLAQVDGHVRVLGLTQDSRAFAGGVRPGDEIRSLSGGAALTSLDDFIRDYATTKHQAKVTGNPSYALSVWRPSEGQLISVQIAAPPTIPKFF